ncbi:MAG: hypothetical protein H0U76_01935, partial [Ktedonobacteraceae bacterium]|nr:hypothetical protein [Ktedonobacteraceae bacterium]
MQQFVHPATHLLQGKRTLFALPRTQLDLNQVAGQKQMIMGNGHNLAPALKLLWSAQTRFCPQQRLLIKAIAMLLTKPQRVPQSHVSYFFLFIATPDQPTDARIALGIAGVRPDDLNHREREPSRFFDMQILPLGNFHGATFAIRSTGVPIGGSIGGSIANLQ